MPVGLSYTLSFSELIEKMTRAQLDKAEEIVHCADTVTLLTCDEVEDIYYQVYKGELN